MKNDPDWRRAKEIFSKALLLVPELRGPFVLAATGKDLKLGKEVNSLLTAYENAQSFLSSPAQVKKSNLKLVPSSFKPFSAVGTSPVRAAPSARANSVIAVA